MNLADIAAGLRAVAEDLRRPAKGEVAEQGVVAWADGHANRIKRLARELTESDDARRAEVRAGLPKKRGGGVIVTRSGGVITRDNLFKLPSAA